MEEQFEVGIMWSENISIYFKHVLRNHINTSFLDNWIGGEGNILCSLWSSDLSLLDFFL
jgi:hypothetical protein